ncbi:Protein-glutamate O-methyltransferase [Saliniradius amylolyticus]|uniref:Chemotaxis protein methyltransferase n=1 Tax=Saliniradius amylolyticus TaxID=2183582 RepID=A0A2S2E6G5_9ALTE|nr:CheR family methyltransferase [Saliniradius amylolyticus]AWL13122.1 Protein-glutamate O-methyltransferase [Saliniradius amylolyticus]
MDSVVLSDRDFGVIRDWLYRKAGIHLGDIKKTLVSGRLQKRLRQLSLTDFRAYIELLESAENGVEHQVAINLLTTNETYFFREKPHYDFLEQRILPDTDPRKPFKVWSAASSTGEEAYTTAFILSRYFGKHGQWEIEGTDINTEVVEDAKRGIYPLSAAKKIPLEYLKESCVKGKGKDAGLFRIRNELRSKVNFGTLNLINPERRLGPFDVVFLRNVLIYFSLPDKQKIVQNVIKNLKPNGWLLVGHSESISGYDERLKQVKAGCYHYKP